MQRETKAINIADHTNKLGTKTNENTATRKRSTSLLKRTSSERKQTKAPRHESDQHRCINMLPQFCLHPRTTITNNRKAINIAAYIHHRKYVSTHVQMRYPISYPISGLLKLRYVGHGARFCDTLDDEARPKVASMQSQFVRLCCDQKATEK
jgi:hypothetical protein